MNRETRFYGNCSVIWGKKRQMICDRVIQNGNIVTKNGIFKGSVGIKNGIIVSISLDPPEGREVTDASGRYVMAGVIDGHVHLDDPGRSSWEDWTCGTQAAAFGGTTCVCDMPINSIPPVTDADGFDAKMKTAKPQACIDYVFWGGLVNDNIAQLPELAAKGAVGYKAFMSASGVEFTTANDAILYEGLKYTKGTNCFIGVHEENDALTAYYSRKMQEQGRTDNQAWLDARPAEEELEAIERFLFWVRHSGGNGHLCHVTVPEAFDEIAQARLEGVHITAETCAHYLWFTDQDFLKAGPVLKCAPPLRSAQVKEKLWQKVLEGKVDMITSDHSPCSYEEKAKGDHNIWKAWGGLGAIQNVAHVMLTAGCHQRGMKLEQLTQLLSENPARRFGIFGRKGVIAPGADADLMIVDPDRKWTFGESDILTKAKFSPYIGAQFEGKVIQTIVRGRTVFEDGHILPSEGWGEYVYPEGYQSSVHAEG